MSAPEPPASTGLTPLELRAWRGLIETTALLRHRLDTLLLADSGLSGSDYPVLVALHETDREALRASELADLIGWERSRLSHQLGRMERRGLLRRTGVAGDSRGTGVSITDEGRRTFLRAAVAHSDAVRAHFVEALTAQQLESLAGTMAALARHLEVRPAVTAGPTEPSTGP